MTNGEKKFLLTSGIIFAVGIIVFVIGLICGGAKQSMDVAVTGGNKLLRYLGSVSGYENAGDMIVDFDPYSNLGFDLKDIPVEGVAIMDKDRYNMDEVDNIYILLKAGDIEVLKSSNDCVGVMAEGSALRFFSRDNSVYITADAIDGAVYIPTNKEYKNITVTTMAGDIEITPELTAETVDVTAIAGDVEITAINAKKGQILLGAGDLEVKNMHVEDYTVSVLMGNSSVFADVDKQLQIYGIGNIELTLSGNKQDYNYEIAAKKGNVQIGDEAWSGADKSIDMGVDKNIIISVGAGNIDVSFK